MDIITQAFLDAQAAGEQPLVLAFLQSGMGRRVYGLQTPTSAQIGSTGGLITYDGSVSVGDNVLFGSANLILGWGDQLLSVGNLRETLSSQGEHVLAGLAGSDIPDMTVRFDNTGEEFSEMLGQERVLGMSLLLRVGYPSLSYADWIDVFQGRITRHYLTDEVFEVTATAGTSSDLSQTFTLGTSSRYANPKSEEEALPLLYGDLTGVMSKTVCIDTVNYYYLIADHAVLSVANGNTFSVYDSDGNAITSGFTIVTSGTDENGKTIAYLDFNAEQEGDIYVGCKGKAVDGVLLENPIDVLEDLLDVMQVSDVCNSTAFARARRIAENQGYRAGWRIDADRTKSALVQSLLGSFFGDWWHNHQNELVVSLDLVGAEAYSIAGFLREADYANAECNEDEENICNQAVLTYALDPMSGEYTGADDGETTKDASSQAEYGVQQHSFSLDEVYNQATARTLSGWIVARFGSQPRLLTVTEQSFRNVAVDRGDYVVAGYKALRDEQGYELKNQIWRVLEITKHFDELTVGVLLQDTGLYYAESPITYDGSVAVGSYDGRLRDRRDFV